MKSAFSFTHLACATLTLVLSTASLVAQQPASATATQQPKPALPQLGEQQTPEPTLKLSPQKTLESFEPPANAEYELGAGDVISLDFPGRPELDVKQMAVGPDGRITLPLAGAIHVADLSRTGAAKAITDSLATYYTDLSVTVSIDKYSSNRVRVMGYVQHPGEIYFEDTPTLLDAIGRAGLIPGAVTKDGAPVSGNNIPETCMIYRGNHDVVTVELRTALTTGSGLADMRLRRNDIVYVPSPKESFVSVLGQVARPGTVALTPATTLVSVLAEAGCCTDAAGGIKVHIIQPSTGQDIVVQYKQLMTLGGVQEYKLHSGDVILIPKSAFYKATDVLQRISPVATMVSIAALVGMGG
ncbi:polysaccharide biosynthesis/export family protein [Acidicapsa ligni]|uniref:polysaccharide biosynthesis/export family protein n=1 Tax=Acidicapsa ligni TaxID=542300 RepID=UPI0021E09010|nr:polysaccharide biosynthesis/export family protein [Acidicapsa ligni]